MFFMGLCLHWTDFDCAVARSGNALRDPDRGIEILDVYEDGGLLFGCGRFHFRVVLMSEHQIQHCFSSDLEEPSSS